VDAAALLTKAERLAPGRTDILLLLAQVSAQLEFYQDAAATYDRYLKLKPADEVARRERSFVLASDGQYQRALPDLERYVHRHPRDAMGSTSWPLHRLTWTAARPSSRSTMR